MGFPSLAAALQEAEESAPEDASKQTLFGFPAQKAFGAEESEVAPESDDGAGATSIINASAFEFNTPTISSEADFDDLPVEEQDEESKAPTMEADLRGTVAGMPLKPRDEFPDDATEVVSGAAVFPGMRLADDGDDDDDVRNKGTLMGMSLADMQAAAPAAGSNSTQFAMPAAQSKPDVGGTQKLQTLKEDSEEQVDDSPTMAWSPGLLQKSDDKDGRKKLLEKIRRSRPAGDSETSESHDGEAQGPDLSALKGLKPKRDPDSASEFPGDDIRDTNEQPSAPPTGVLRTAGQRRSSQSGTIPAPVGGLGAAASLEQADEAESLESISDPEFGLMETDIASGDILKQAVQNLAARGVNVEPDVSPAPLRTKKAIYDTFDGGSGSAPKPAPPAGPMTVPTKLPAQLAPQPTPQPAPQPVPQRPVMHTPSASYAQPQHNHSSQNLPRPQPPSAQLQPSTPYVPPTTSTELSADERLVRVLQGLFGLGAGFVALLVQTALLATRGIPPKLGGIAVVVLGVFLGLSALFAALFPLPAKMRSLAFYAIAGALMLCGLLGLAVALPNGFLAVWLAALLAAVAGAFPSLARMLA